MYEKPRFWKPTATLARWLAGVLAAVGPAWRASRLDVLEAIATE